MNAFVERLWCPVWIIRAGLEADRYGKPFDYAVAVAVPWLSLLRWLFGLKAPVIIKALVADGNLKTSHRAAAFRLLLSMGFEPKWERIK